MRYIILALALAVFVPAVAQADTIYIGSYHVEDGDFWTTNPDVYSALEAAELVFGAAGPNSWYEISTKGSDVGSIDNMGWYAIIGRGPGVFAEGYSKDGGPTLGYNGSGWSPGDDISAYVDDPFFGANEGRNYVFLTTVPEPGSLALFGLGAIGLVLHRRRKAKASA